MNFTMGLLAAAPAALISTGLALAILPEPSHMTVHDMLVTGEQVTADRHIHIDGVMDWRVTIVHKEKQAPSCQTVSGPNLHEGWSYYEAGERAEATMHLDVWVGDVGCFGRLAEGPHNMYVTWTPRDGTEPIVAQTDFVK